LFLLEKKKQETFARSSGQRAANTVRKLIGKRLFASFSSEKEESS
jgi:hypothetical protein